MPPKGSKNKQPNQAVVAAAAPDSVAKLEVKVELPNGEADKANLSYIDLVQKAKDVIDNHPLFRNIESELPLQITANKTESGVQTPFDSEACKHALRAQSKMYTCGVNLFWINFLWSPTPGVPLRCSAIETLSNSKFAEPCILESVHVAVLDKDFDPLVHKGSLQRVSPEEITAAMILAIARDIQADAPDHILKSWRTKVLSTTCTFILLADSTARYWYALQQRENFTVTHAAVNRSVFQRMHEIHRLMKGMRESHTSSDITSASVTKVYEENLRMAPGSASTVSNNFVDSIITAINRMLFEPEIAYCLQDLDEKSALCDDPNPFNSHVRLQYMCDKSCKSQQNLITIVQAIWYNWIKGTHRSLSGTDIKGTAATGNRGLADLFVYKHLVKSNLLQWGSRKLPDSKDWIMGPVKEATTSHKAWLAIETAGNQSFRAGKKGSESKWLNVLIEVAFGRLYDGPLKLSCKSSRTPDDALTSPGLVEVLDEISAKVALEAGPAEVEEVVPGVNDTEDVDDDVVFMLQQSDGTTTNVRSSSIGNTGQKELLDSIMAQTKAQIAANIHLVPLELETVPDEAVPALITRMLRTPACKVKGSPNTTNPAKTKYVGIFFDVKLAGEATHRPALRIPPLQAAKYQGMLKDVMQRHEPTEELNDGDVFFILDGGKLGNHHEFLKPFPKTREIRRWTVCKDEESLSKRYTVIRGVGVCKFQSETLITVSQSTLALKRHSFKHMKGTSAGTVMGPLIMTPPSDQWQLSWKTKKMIYGSENLIPVGGKADDDGLEEISVNGEKSRTPATVEPVFYHGSPPTFYEDLITAFGLTAIIDCTPGDGALAISAYKANIMYTGLTFNQEHALHLQQQLESTIWRSMTTDTDPLFEPRLLHLLQGTTDPPAPKKKSKGSLKRKRDPDPDPDPDGAGDPNGASEGEGEGEDEGALSGDAE